MHAAPRHGAREPQSCSSSALRRYSLPPLPPHPARPSRPLPASLHLLRMHSHFLATHGRSDSLRNELEGLCSEEKRGKSSVSMRRGEEPAERHENQRRANHHP